VLVFVGPQRHRRIGAVRGHGVGERRGIRDGQAGALAEQRNTGRRAAEYHDAPRRLAVHASGKSFSWCCWRRRLFLVTSSFTLAKVIRDQQEAATIRVRLDEVKHGWKS
jgi:hypothetical protein